MIDHSLVEALFFSVSWILTVVLFMYVSLKFITNRFNVHPAWIWSMTPVNLVWLLVSMLLANVTFFIVGKLIKFLWI